MKLIEKVQQLLIVAPEVATGRHHTGAGRTPATELVRREAATTGRRAAKRA